MTVLGDVAISDAYRWSLAAFSWKWLGGLREESSGKSDKEPDSASNGKMKAHSKSRRFSSLMINLNIR